MADGGGEEPEELSDKQKAEIARWFLTSAPAGEIQYVAKDVRSILGDDKIYELAAAEAFPVYNKTHFIALQMPDRSGDVLITTYGELDKNNYLDPRTAQVATVDHAKQVCTSLRPANDEELPSAYVEEFRRRIGPMCLLLPLQHLKKEEDTREKLRGSLDAELSKYVAETYPKGTCAVYSTSGKDSEGPGVDFEFAVVISAAKHSPQNFCNGSWRSIWTVDFKDDTQIVEIKGKIQVVAHYFEEGNVQLDAKNECKDSTIFQDLRRKLPVTRTLFPWQNTIQFSLTKDINKELGIGK
ncbi:hypothetical protein ZIOFF_064043 [Zingiber officinale]|uniref:F-actin-capping protein subunit alpha n=1 Tax=Zingiber officinale TaxID=94328 RepID=A0A8J5CF43_ZINOF|nr:hypothetical protein ZIOFF_064043 [Zingiber officinale]